MLITFMTLQKRQLCLSFFFIFLRVAVWSAFFSAPQLSVSLSLPLSPSWHLFRKKGSKGQIDSITEMKKINKVPQSPPMAMMTTQMMKSPLIHKKKCMYTYIHTYIHTYAYTHTCISRVSHAPRIIFLWCSFEETRSTWRLHNLQIYVVLYYTTNNLISYNSLTSASLVSHQILIGHEFVQSFHNVTPHIS